MQEDSINRFTVRAHHYDKYRPGYPSELMEYLRASANLTPGEAAADIAAGTGIFTAGLLPWGNTVYAIEPNQEMRSLAKVRLETFENVIFREGTAEKTTLPDQSVRLITCAQAFHWFNPDACKTEFSRIALPDTKAAIIWNRRNTLSPFEMAYERLILSNSEEYLSVTQHRISDDDMLSFFYPHLPIYRIFEHHDQLDYDQLRGRTLSYSFLPKEGTDVSINLLGELRRLFDSFQVGGHIRLSYTTRLFLGDISPG